MKSVHTDDWTIEEVEDGSGGLWVSFVQALPTPEEEDEIRAKHGEHADPDEHFKPKTIRLLCVDEDLDDLYRLLKAWRNLNES